MKVTTRFCEPGDITGKWRFERRLTHKEKIFACKNLLPSSAGSKNIRKAARRGLVEATCMGCGVLHTIRADYIRSGRSTQCRTCRQNIKSNPYANRLHPWYPIYTRLVNIQQRCCNPKNPAYPDYGGRGVRVHDRYSITVQTLRYGSARHAVENFVEDNGLPPNGDFTLYQIDRIKNDSNDPLPGTMDYCPGNIRWTRRETQARNKRNSVKVSVKSGPQMHINELAELAGLRPGTLKYRLASGRYRTSDELVMAIGGKARKRMLRTIEQVSSLIQNGRYWASPDGRVFSIKPNGIIELNQFTNEDGYRVVKLCFSDTSDAKSWAFPVHRLVALQYWHNPDPGKFLLVAHIDDNPENNTRENLCWCTFALNAQAMHRPVEYPKQIPQDLSPFTEDGIERRIRSEYIDTIDYSQQAEKQLRWGYDREALSPRIKADPRYQASIYHPDHPRSDLAWRLLLAPSNNLCFEDDDITIELSIKGELARRSIFLITPSRDWSAYFVWYADELRGFGLDVEENDWSARPLEEPERANIRNLVGERRTSFHEQDRIVKNSLFLKFPQKAKLLFPSPGTGKIQHPLYISAGSNAKIRHFRCEGCMRRILDPHSAKNVTRAPDKGHRRPLCAHCEKEKSVRNLSRRI